MSQGSRPASLPAAVRAWLTQPELTRLWDKVHERLQRNGIAVHGHVLIADATHAEREALSLLMGRSYTTARVSIALADLDARLRASAAGSGVTDVVAELRGELVEQAGRAQRPTGGAGTDLGCGRRRHTVRRPRPPPVGGGVAGGDPARRCRIQAHAGTCDARRRASHLGTGPA